MRSLVWKLIRVALEEKSAEAIKVASEAIANYLPMPAEQIAAFLSAAVAAVIRLGDQWAEQLAGALLGLPGCDADACNCDELQDHQEVVAAIQGLS